MSDTQLHFVYNAIAYVGLVTPFWFLMRTTGLGPPQRDKPEAVGDSMVPTTAGAN